jgi:hypothetical protein
MATRKPKSGGKKTSSQTGRGLKAKKAAEVKGGAFNAFANFRDITGETTDKDHTDWISLLSHGNP